MLGEQVQDRVDVVILAAIAFLVPVIIGGIVSIALRAMDKSTGGRRNRVYRLVAGSIGIASFLIGVISCLGTLGVDTTALVAGLGLTGLALGLALRDAVSNFISGVMIILYSPFDLGDQLDVLGTKGTVTDMDLRYVMLENDAEYVLIPNSTFLNSVVKRLRDPSDAGEDTTS